MKPSLVLAEQPYDEYLLNQCDLYRKSRELFRKQGGQFVPSLLSSARSLGSVGLLSNTIEYSPVGSEFHWSRTDRLQRKEVDHMLAVQSWITAVFHEQNHRILWSFLKTNRLYCPRNKDAAFRYLNLTESLVVILDMALADSLTQNLSETLYSQRVIYHVASPAMKRFKVGSLKYREALFICMHAVFLRLEGLHPDDLLPTLTDAFPGTSVSLLQTITDRALGLEPRFVDITNPVWQAKHVKQVIESMGEPKGKSEGLVLPKRKPADYSLAFEITGKWLKLFGI